MEAFRHILVPTDFGPSSRLAVDYAVELAERYGATLTLLHVQPLPPAYGDGIYWPYEQIAKEADAALRPAVAELKKRHADTHGLLASGVVWDQILALAKDRGVDLVVMGTHGRHGLPRAVLGSVAEKVVRLSPVPVLTVHASEPR
ncbi:MAG TPA: universal stress protein [Minicystis sp.]|nr:universal stress protein [Minicystis sp.]